MDTGIIPIFFSFSFICCYKQCFGCHPCKCFLELPWSKSRNHWHLLGEKKFFFKQIWFIRAVQGLTAKWSGKYRVLQNPPWHLPSLPHGQRGTRAASSLIDEPTLTHHHPRPQFTSRVQSWCGTICGFRPPYKDTYLPLWDHTECFHHPKNAVLCLFIPPPSLIPGKPLILLLSP